MTATHTPGPWILTRTPHRFEVRTDKESSYAFSLLDVANARLIAAAPELLAALEAIVGAVERFEAHPEHWPELLAANAAIAKAKGI